MIITSEINASQLAEAFVDDMTASERKEFVEELVHYSRHEAMELWHTLKRVMEAEP